MQLHPSAAAIYRTKVRALIDRMVLAPDEAAPDRLRVELHGDLPMILQLGRKEEREPAAEHKKLPGTGVPGESTVGGCGGRI